MLSLYEPYEEFFEPNRIYVPLIHLASELVDEYGYRETSDLEAALEQSFSVCIAMDININDHFKKVYVYRDNDIITDWLMSDLGSYLLLINGSTRNPVVAQARMYAIKH